MKQKIIEALKDFWNDIRDWWLLKPEVNPNDPYHRMISPKLVGERLKEMLRQKAISIENSEHDYMRGRINVHQYIRELIFDITRLDQEILMAEDRLTQLDRAHKQKKNDKGRKNNPSKIGIETPKSEPGEAIRSGIIVAHRRYHYDA